MNAFPRTSAPRSAVIHGLGRSGRVTICGRIIGDNWTGQNTAQPHGAISCGRCLTGIDPREAGPIEAPREVTSLPSSVMSLPAESLRKGDSIHFGDEWVSVLGVDLAPGCEPVVITEDANGSQFIDYVSPARVFATFRPTV